MKLYPGVCVVVYASLCVSVCVCVRVRAREFTYIHGARMASRETKTYNTDIK